LRIKIVTFGGIKLRRFLAGQYPAGMAFALYVASVATLCVALYQCNRRDGTLTATAYGSLLFVVLSIIPFLCLLLVGCGAYFSLVRAKRASGVLAANLSELAQIVLVITAVPLILFCLIAQVPATAAALMQVPHMSQGPLWHVSTDQRLLRVTGEFTPGIAEAVEKSLAGTRSVRIVVFDSPGGDVEEAMRIGRDIREKGLTTGVSKECSSACTYSFVAGRQRILLPGGRLGFHACQKVVWFSPCENEKYSSYLVTSGIDESFIRRALSVEPPDVWYPRPEELLAAHVVTTTRVDGSESGGN
jgi:hypothetical protein